MSKDDKAKKAVSAVRLQNPFSSWNRDRENFPNLESFFRPASEQSMPTEPVPSFPSYHDDDDAGDGDSSSSILNISIGARAALAEHLRQVAKHGIDGEQSPGQGDTDVGAKNILDQKWEFFLEQHSAARLDSSTEVSFPRSSRARRHADMFSNTSGPDQSMEAMTDISQDYFNSSRVQQLATPERNKARTNFVSTRNDTILADDDGDDEFLIDDDEKADVLAPELFAIHSSSTEEHRQNPNQSSFLSASFCAPDISRISSADDSEPRALQRTPNTSFQLHLQQHFHLDEDPHSNAPIQGTDDSPLFLASASPPPVEADYHYYHPPMDSSFNSLPSVPTSTMSSPPTWGQATSSAAPLGEHSLYSGTNVSSPRRSQSAPLITTSDSFGKENYRPRRSNASSYTGSRRQRPVRGRKNDSSSSSSGDGLGTRHFSALDTMPTDFMEAIEMAHVEDDVGGGGGGPLSPISQAGSNQVSIRYESSSSSSRRRDGPDHSTRGNHRHARMVPYPPVASMPAQDTSTSTSASSSNQSLTGRKRFRTVVPRRVYMGSPSQFPDEQDSFGHASPSTEHSNSDGRAHRSLLDSFDAAIDTGDDIPNISGCSACYSSY